MTVLLFSWFTCVHRILVEGVHVVGAGAGV